MIGSRGLAVIVEGKRHDRPFYEHVLESIPEAVALGFQIFLIEEIGGTGGKPAGLSLFDTLRRDKKLVQRTRGGEKRFLFAFDRDYDHLIGGQRRSPHVMYTKTSDVESEIFSNTSIVDALKFTLSTDSSTSAMVGAELGQYLNDLGVLWRDWITLCCVAEGVGARCAAKSSIRSLVNASYYGVVQPAEVSRLKAEIVLTRRNPSKEAPIRRRVRNIYLRGEGNSLVKGKHVPDYLLHRITGIAARKSIVIDTRDFTRTITKVATAFLSLESEHQRHYSDAVRRVAST